MSVRLHIDAEIEVQDACRWYDRRRPGLGTALYDALLATFHDIETAPLAYPTCPDARSGRDVRQTMTRGFPYLVIYEVRAAEILILAVSHASRRPGYWLHRNGGTP
jgi:toxin ParE1/3/4